MLGFDNQGSVGIEVSTAPSQVEDGNGCSKLPLESGGICMHRFIVTCRSLLGPHRLRHLIAWRQRGTSM